MIIEVLASLALLSGTWVVIQWELTRCRAQIAEEQERKG